MKTREEVARYKEILEHLAANPEPCNCAATGHTFECVVGHYQIVANIFLLEWILDNPVEAPSYQKMVDTLTEHVRERRAKTVKN